MQLHLVQSLVRGRILRGERLGIRARVFCDGSSSEHMALLFVDEMSACGLGKSPGHALDAAMSDLKGMLFRKLEGFRRAKEAGRKLRRLCRL
jgi:hypothetical protein